MTDNEFNVIDSLKLEELNGYKLFPIGIFQLATDSILIHGMAYDSVSNDLQIYLVWFDENLNILKDSLYGDLDKIEFPGQVLINYFGNIVIHGIINPDWINGGKDKENERFFWEIDPAGNSVNYVTDTLVNQGFGLVPIGSSGKYHLTAIDYIYQLNQDFSLDTVYNFDLPNFSTWFTRYFQENEYLIFGQYYQGLNPINPNILDFDLAVLRLNNTTNVLSYYTIGIEDTNDRVGGLDFYYPDTLIVGGTKHVINGPVDNWIEVYKTDLSGQTYFEYFYGGYGKYNLGSVTATKDGGCIMTGTWWDFYNYPEPNEQVDAFIIKLNSDGLITSTNRPDIPFDVTDILVYPNPGNDWINISSAKDHLLIRFYDVSGNLVLIKEFDKQTKINTTHLPTGTYIYTVYQNDELIMTGKWAKVK